MDYRCQISGYEGSPRALCSHDTLPSPQGVSAERIVGGRLRHRRDRVPAEDTEVDRALEAMSAPELRAAVRTVLEELDEGVKASVVDTLIARATKATSGWRPTRPSRRIVEKARSFAEAARHIGHADPDDVTEHLSRATKAFLAGDHASARAVFEAILPPDCQRGHRPRPARARRGSAGSRRADVRRAVRHQCVHDDALW